MRWTVLVLLCSFAAPAAAQPVVLPAEMRGGAEPDTTSPWRYFPLAVGSAWEWEDDKGILKRRTVDKDTVALGQRYFIVRDAFARNGEVFSTYRRPLRFDTTSATVRFLVPTNPPSEIHELECPLDASFDTTVECEFGPYAVTGTYEGVLVFGGESPGMGRDTVRTAVKRYASTQTGFETRFGAGVGIVLELGDGLFRALTYYRIGDEEYGVAQFPVAVEGGTPEVQALALEVYPNPARGSVRVAFQVTRPSEVKVAVYDVLGRAVVQRDLDVRPAGRQEVVLDAAHWRAGTYVVRLTAGGETVNRLVTRVR